MAVSKISKRKQKLVPELNSPALQVITPAKQSSFLSKINWKNWKTWIVILVAALILGYYLRNNKAWFLAAVVDGVPVTKAELNSRLISLFGQQTLDTLIGEKIIFAEAVKQNVSVEDKEIDEKLKELEKNLGQNVNFDDFLKLQGMTKAELTNRLRMQIVIDKMFSKDVSVSALEISDYIASNSATLSATESGTRQEQASKEVRSSKVGKLFIDWFNKKRGDAKIERYL